MPLLKSNKEIRAGEKRPRARQQGKIQGYHRLACHAPNKPGIDKLAAPSSRTSRQSKKKKRFMLLLVPETERGRFLSWVVIQRTPDLGKGWAKA